MQNVVKLAPLIKPCMILEVTLFLVYDGSVQLSTFLYSEFISPLIADNTVYHGYCKNYFCPTVDEE